ncbi:MAG: pyruvate kinase, partial [Gammaproteobacteria bacterium]|nr:pyruvate kinase [Gammaproteobacteria bacterium]
MITRRRTKIVVTLGPALDDDKVLERTFLAGADVFRANFSHGSPEEHAKRISKIRALSKKHNREVAVFADLQGPKIRIARFKNEKVILKENAKFILDATLDDDAGNEQMVGIDYKELPKDVEKEDTLLLDDGRIVFKVLKKEGSRVFCRVV